MTDNRTWGVQEKRVGFNRRWVWRDPIRMTKTEAERQAASLTRLFGAKPTYVVRAKERTP